MPNYLAMLRSAGRPPAGTSGDGPPEHPAAGSGGPEALAGERGFLLIEVLISAMLVAIIVVATFSGFEAATRTSADQRRHNEAAVLAAQSQEALRSDPASALDALEYASHSYTKTVGGTTYTITQEAQPLNSSGTGTGCNATESKAENGANIQITSSVNWALLQSAKRLPLKDVSVITPPIGSALEVDVTNGGVQDVQGVTAKATFVPVESSAPTTVEGITNNKGCVVLTGIAATSATVEIPERTGFVTPWSSLIWKTKEVKIAPNITTHYPVTYDEGGRINAKFTYAGKEIATAGQGSDTFVAFNSAITEGAKFLVGSTAFTYSEVEGEEKYKASTGTYEATASTPGAVGGHFPNSDLFPFESSKWSVYAGDCTKDNPEALTAKSSEEIKDPSALVEPGKAQSVEIPLSYLTLNIANGIYPGTKTLETATPYPVKITNAECAGGGTPNGASGTTLTHTQNTSSGHLTNPYQPWGKYEFCLYNAANKTVFKTTFTNLTTAGSKLEIFPAELTKAKWEAQETANHAKYAAEKIKEPERKNKETAELKERQTAEKERGYTIESGASC